MSDNSDAIIVAAHPDWRSGIHRANGLTQRNIDRALCANSGHLVHHLTRLVDRETQTVIIADQAVLEPEQYPRYITSRVVYLLAHDKSGN